METNPFFQIIDNVTRSWVKLTYDTPISQLPVFGLKSSLNPLGSYFRGRYGLAKKDMDQALPPAPYKGPPLPRALGIEWPAYKIADKILPASPLVGPPLPRSLGIKWPKLSK